MVPTLTCGLERSNFSLAMCPRVTYPPCQSTVLVCARWNFPLSLVATQAPPVYRVRWQLFRGSPPAAHVTLLISPPAPARITEPWTAFAWLASPQLTRPSAVSEG